MYYYRHINKSVSLSNKLWLRKVGLPVFFLPVSFPRSENDHWKRISGQEVACFHSKKHKKHDHIILMFNYEELSLEVEWKISRAIFQIRANHDPAREGYGKIWQEKREGHKKLSWHISSEIRDSSESD